MFSITSPVSLTLIFKIGTLAVLILFILFLFVILKQVSSMNKVITQPNLYPMLILLGWILLGLGLALFIVSVVIL